MPSHANTFTAAMTGNGNTTQNGGVHGKVRITRLVAPPQQSTTVPTFTVARGTNATTFAVSGKSITALGVTDPNSDSVTSSISFVDSKVYTTTTASSTYDAATLGWLTVSGSATSMTVSPKVIMSNKTFYVRVKNNLNVENWVQFKLTSTTKNT
jgi:hypothetical protein